MPTTKKDPNAETKKREARARLMARRPQELADAEHQAAQAHALKGQVSRARTSAWMPLGGT